MTAPEIVAAARMRANQTYAVAMLGARMHHAVPRILHAASQLSRFYTDFDTRTLLSPAIAGLVRRSLGEGGLISARSSVLPLSLVRAFNLFGLEYKFRLSRCRTQMARIRTYLWGGKRFCELVLKSRLPPGSGIFAYNSVALELLEHAKAMGTPAVMEQTIAPYRMEYSILEEERRRYPNWEDPVPWSDDMEAYAQREEAEWRAADTILCGSQFVIDGIRKSGGPAEKCRLVPYGYDPPASLSPSLHAETPTPPYPHTPLRVLVVGTVCLRKGTPYVLEAAKALGRRVEFRMAGNILVSPQAEAELRKHVTLMDRVPRDQMSGLYRWADVFLLPSVCEGSATVVYEALAYGLPVICTPNTGSIVTSNKDGFIVPQGDTNAIVEALEGIISTPGSLSACSVAAHATAAEHDLRAYGERLLAALGAVS